MFYGLSHKKGYRQLEVNQEDLMGMVSHNRKALANLITIFTLLILSVWFLVHFALFLVNDVLLFQKEVAANDIGAFTQSKTCESEQAMYLFTTSDLWANTGIQLHKGDRVKLSASGAFNTSIQGVYKGALLNSKPKYDWISVGNINDTVASLWKEHELSMFPTSHYGTLLYQLRNDAEPLESDWSKFLKQPLDAQALKDVDERRRWSDTLSRVMGIHPFPNSEDYIEVEEDGVLHVSANDIYLNDIILRRYADGNKAIVNDASKYAGPMPLVSGSDTLVNARYKNLFLLYYYPKNDTLTGDSMIYIAGNKFIEYFRENRDAWFKDNVGQIAITADIQHRITGWPFRQVSWYRHIETLILNIRNNPWNIALLLLEFIILIPIVFAVAYTILTAIIYYGLQLLLWLWDVVSGMYLRVFRLKRPRR